jgi:hypothetical protein
MALEVSVISKRSFLDDPVSWIAGASTIGEIEVTSVADMASKLVDLRNAQSTTTESALIGRLNQRSRPCAARPVRTSAAPPTR